VPAHEAFAIELCSHPGCGEDADVAGFCFYHSRDAPEAPPLPAREEETVETVKTRPKTKPWTREEAIAAVQAYHARVGRSPGTEDSGSRNSLPTFSVAQRLFGSWPAMVSVAGLTPLGGGGRSRTRDRSETSSGSPTSTRGGETGTVKPPPDEQATRTPAAPVAADPAPQQAPRASVDGTANGSLQSLAARIEALAEGRAELLAELTKVELELTQLASLLHKKTQALIPFADAQPA